ncbi:hypothetical protein EDB92DRAFT_1875147, partial [Lactarius akahatsu]
LYCIDDDGDQYTVPPRKEIKPFFQLIGTRRHQARHVLNEGLLLSPAPPFGGTSLGMSHSKCTTHLTQHRHISIHPGEPVTPGLSCVCTQMATGEAPGPCGGDNLHTGIRGTMHRNWRDLKRAAQIVLQKFFPTEQLDDFCSRTIIRRLYLFSRHSSADLESVTVLTPAEKGAKSTSFTVIRIIHSPICPCAHPGQVITIRMKAAITSAFSKESAMLDSHSLACTKGTTEDFSAIFNISIERHGSSPYYHFTSVANFEVNRE